MPIYNLYVFNRDGACIYYKEWKRTKQSGMPRSQEAKLMFGMLSSLRSFSERLATKDGHQTVLNFKTSAYKLNYMESPTGLKMALLTDPSAPAVPDLLRRLYLVYVETITNNVLINPSEELKSELFSTRVDQEVSSHSSFNH